MADVANKYPENVAGKYYVDNQCIDCDLCRETAPDNFKRNDDGGYSFVYKQPARRPMKRRAARKPRKAARSKPSATTAETVKQDRLNTAAITHMRNLTYILLGIIIFGFVVTLSHGNNIVINCVIIAGCAFLGFVPFFDKKRIRADWAKLVFGIIAVIGIAGSIGSETRTTPDWPDCGGTISSLP
jgi:ferredoxin